MGHSYVNLFVHVIFSTKNRRPLILPDMRPRLYEYLAGIARKEFGSALSIGGTENHVHGLLSLNGKLDMPKVMERWKSLSSGWVHRAFAGSADFAWQRGYGAFSVSPLMCSRVRSYIARQEEHHKKQTFEEEFTAFLQKYRIPYDPKHM